MYTPCGCHSLKRRFGSPRARVLRWRVQVSASGGERAFSRGSRPRSYTAIRPTHELRLMLLGGNGWHDRVGPVSLR